MSCGIENGIKAMKPLVQAGVSPSQSFSGLTVKALRCEKCGYIRFPSPSPEVLDDYYRNVYGPLAKAWYNVETDFGTWKRTRRADRVVQIATAFGHGKTASFHEVGCAHGGTVFELQQRGYQASGTDLNAAAIEEGRQLGVVDTKALHDIDYLKSRDTKPDVIYGFHVLEHMPDPVTYLRDVSQFLADGGIIAMFVPNALALHPLVNGYSSYNWFSFPGHLHYLSAGSAQCLANAADLVLIEVSSHVVPGVTPPTTPRGLAPTKQSAVADYICDKAIEAAFLGEELQFVLCSRATADAFAAKRAHAEQQSADLAVMESRIRDLGEKAT